MVVAAFDGLFSFVVVVVFDGAVIFPANVIFCLLLVVHWFTFIMTGRGSLSRSRG